MEVEVKDMLELKSSTFHKTELSRERLIALEKMLGESSLNQESAPGVYIRRQNAKKDSPWFTPNRSKSQLTTKQLCVAFVAGVLCTLFVTSHFSQPTLPDFEGWTKENITEKINVSPADVPAPTVNVTQYTVKSGDTVDSIAMRFYGVYDLEKIQKIQTVNNLEDISKIKLGQVLTIPMD